MSRGVRRILIIIIPVSIKGTREIYIRFIYFVNNVNIQFEMLCDDKTGESPTVSVRPQKQYQSINHIVSNAWSNRRNDHLTFYL